MRQLKRQQQGFHAALMFMAWNVRNPGARFAKLKPFAEAGYKIVAKGGKVLTLGFDIPPSTQ